MADPALPTSDPHGNAALLARAEARIAGVDFTDPHVTFDLEIIRDLLAALGRGEA